MAKVYNVYLSATHGFILTISFDCEIYRLKKIILM